MIVLTSTLAPVIISALAGLIIGAFTLGLIMLIILKLNKPNINF